MERIEALVPQEVVASRVRGPGCGAYLLAELAELCVRARRCEAGYPSLHPERPNKGARAFSVTSAVGSLVGSAVGSLVLGRRACRLGRGLQSGLRGRLRRGLSRRLVGFAVGS